MIVQYIILLMTEKLKDLFYFILFCFLIHILFYRNVRMTGGEVLEHHRWEVKRFATVIDVQEKEVKESEMTTRFSPVHL